MRAQRARAPLRMYRTRSSVGAVARPTPAHAWRVVPPSAAAASPVDAVTPTASPP